MDEQHRETWDRAKEIRAREWISLFRRHNPEADAWAAGYGRIQHSPETQERVFRMAEVLNIEMAAQWRVLLPVHSETVGIEVADVTGEAFVREGIAFGVGGQQATSRSPGRGMKPRYPPSG